MTVVRRLGIVALVTASIAGVIAVVVGHSVPQGPRTSPSARDQSPELTSSTEPSARNAPSLAYFPPDHEVVLFGGQGDSARSLGDTWVFDRHGWRELHPPMSPPPRAQATMAYDPSLGEIVLYGGCGYCGSPGYRLLQDTWAFNGSTWKPMRSLRTPDYEPNPVISWDVGTRQLELLAPPPGYGPQPPNGDFNSGTSELGQWAWTTTGWSWQGSDNGPPLTIQEPAFTAEPGTKDMLYFAYNPYSGSCPDATPHHHFECGADPTGLLYSQTWQWNGGVRGGARRPGFTADTPVAPSLQPLHDVLPQILTEIRKSEVDPAVARRAHQLRRDQPQPVLARVVGIHIEPLGNMTYVRGSLICRHCDEEGSVDIRKTGERRLVDQ